MLTLYRKAGTLCLVDKISDQITENNTFRTEFALIRQKREFFFKKKRYTMPRNEVKLIYVS